MLGKCRLFPPGVDGLLILPSNAVGVVLPCICTAAMNGGKQLFFFSRTVNTVCIDE